MARVTAGARRLAKDSATDPSIYPAGSPGPDEADKLLARGGRRWRSVGATTMEIAMSRARPLPFKCSAVISDVDGTLVTDERF